MAGGCPAGNPTPSPSEREGVYWDVGGRTRLGQEAPGNEALWLVVRRTELRDEAGGGGLIFKGGIAPHTLIVPISGKVIDLGFPMK